MPEGTSQRLTVQQKIERLRERRTANMAGGGDERIAKQHDAGKLTARERISRLLDVGSFQELYLFARHRQTHFGMGSKNLPADAVITGVGTIDRRLVHLASQDFTVGGGAAGEIHCAKIADMMTMSLKTGSPFIFINDSGGARVQEGVDSLAGYGRVFYHNVLLSGVVPQISLICGPCAGGAAYSPALTDFIIQTRRAQMFITGPSVIKQVTGEEISAEDLGGPEAQAAYSGVVHFVTDSDDEALALCRRLLAFLPSNNLEAPPRLEHDGVISASETLNTIVPDDPRKPFDMRAVIHEILDGGDFLEVQRHYAQNVLIGFGRVLGQTVGVVANQPMVMAGALDIDSSDKVSRFVRFCNAFNIPLVTLVDVPGFMPGVKQEYGGIIRHGAKMLFAYSAATVPKVSIVVRKAFGGAYLAMCGKDLGADRVAAWPTAEIAVMGAEGAVGVVFRKEIKESAEPAEKRSELIELYRNTFSTPYIAASRGLVDDIIEPADTRRYIARALDALETKRELRPEKKHGLIPL